MATDNMYDILAIAEKQKADEAREVGDSRAQTIHSAQAGRWSNLAKEQRLSREEPEFDYSSPLTHTEMVQNAMISMRGSVHIENRNGQILCNPHLTFLGDYTAKLSLIPFRPTLATAKLVRAYRATMFHQETGKFLCRGCLNADSLIKTGM